MPTVGDELEQLTYQFRLRISALEDAAWSNGSLTEGQKHLLLLAEAAAITSLDSAAIRHHTQAARQAGCSSEEILEVAELTATLPIHACTEGMPALAGSAGLDAGKLEAGFTVEQRAAKARFTDSRGYWSDFWTLLLGIDPKFFESYSELSSRPWESGVLDPYFKELVYLAFDASPRHLYRPGIEIHSRNALALGASVAQISCVFALLSTSGRKSMDAVASALADGDQV